MTAILNRCVEHVLHSPNNFLSFIQKKSDSDYWVTVNKCVQQVNSYVTSTRDTSRVGVV